MEETRTRGEIRRWENESLWGVDLASAGFQIQMYNVPSWVVENEIPAGLA